MIAIQFKLQVDTIMSILCECFCIFCILLIIVTHFHINITVVTYLYPIYGANSATPCSKLHIKHGTNVCICAKYSDCRSNK
jgi:hypothetical protein